MLSASGSLQFRHQNDPLNRIELSHKSAKFLPANFYPIQTPGYTVQWTKTRAEVIERIGETAKIVHEFDLSHLSQHESSQIFNPIPKHERPRQSMKSGVLLFQNFSGWIFKKFIRADQKEMAPKIEIINVIPLMFDETVFDSVLVLKNNNERIGFVRIRLLMTGNLKNIQRLNDFIPALIIKSSSSKPAILTSWKHLIFAFDGVAVKFINLNDSRNEWKALEIPKSVIEEICICEDKSTENKIILLLKNSTENVYNIVKFDSLGEPRAELINVTIEIEESYQVCGYIENDNLYVIQGQNLYEISIGTDYCDVNVFLFQGSFQFLNSKLYLFPWRQDLKVSALLFYLTRNNKNKYMISIMSIIGSKSEIILESDWFENEYEIVSMFATSSLELFLLDEGGNVQIYSGLLLNTDWQWRHTNSIIFEFTHWFNILGDFPFKPVEYYSSRRLQVNDSLFIDELLKHGIEFPPTNWKSLGHACRQLKDENIELILYYLLASGTSSPKMQSFYNQFGLKDRQVSAIELAFACDHGDYSRASKVFCTRKIEEEIRLKFTGKIVKFMKSCAEVEELTKFSLYAAGRIISIDLILEDSCMMAGMLESILKSRGIPAGLDWIKGLFAWLRPDDRCALIPVATLHQTFIKRLLEILLNCEDNSEFKRLGNEFIDAPFDPEMLRTILAHLSGDLNENSSSDRSAWLITMICAIRSRLHEYLLEFDFGAVRDEEVKRGIEGIRDVIRKNFKRRDECETAETGFAPSTQQTPHVQQTQQAFAQSPCRISSPKALDLSLKSSPSQSTSSLLNVYARTPSSPKSSPATESTLNRFQGKNVTFKPRHFPTKKPTTLKIEKDGKKETGEEDDPFEEDLRLFKGKRMRQEISEDLLRSWKEDQQQSNDTDVVILTKDDEVKTFESAINVTEKRKSKRRRR